MRDETPRMRFLRYILIALLFCAVIWGFWMNNERRVNLLKKNAGPVIDATGVLGTEQLNELARFQERFAAVYGLNLIILIRNEPFPEPFLAPRERGATVFLGLAPKQGQVLFELPPLAEAALGEETTRRLRHTHFMPYFTDNSWPEGLAEALNLLAQRFDAALLPGERALPSAPSAPPDGLTP